MDIAVDAVVARIRNAGPSYWNVGSGGATLHRGRADSTTRIDASAPGARGITARVKKIVAQCLDVEPSEVTARARFIADFGADPLAVVELVMTIEEELGVEIPETAKITSLQDLLAVIAEAQG